MYFTFLEPKMNTKKHIFLNIFIIATCKLLLIIDSGLLLLKMI